MVAELEYKSDYEIGVEVGMEESANEIKQLTAERDRLRAAAQIQECHHRIVDVSSQRLKQSLMCINCGKLFASERSGE